MAANKTTDSDLSPTMMTYYVKEFLAVAKEEMVYEEGLQERTHPKNSGKTVNFTRYARPAQVTSALTEGSNPPEADLEAETVAATLAEFGNSWKLSRFLTLTDIDDNNKEKIQLAGQNMGESRDTRIRNELFTGATIVRPNNVAADTDITSSMKLDATLVRRMATKLRKNKALKFAGRFPWMAKIGTESSFDLMGDSVWNNAKTYSDVQKLYQGELGELHGTRFLVSTQPKVEEDAGASSADLYSNFFHGKEAAAKMDLEGDMFTVNIIPHTKLDSGNTAGRFGWISWAGSEAKKVLNDDWLLNLKTAATDV